MKGTIKAKFRRNQFFYTSDSWREKGSEYVMILTPLIDLYDLKENQVGFFVNEKEVTVEGEGYIIRNSEIVEFKRKIKELFFNDCHIKKENLEIVALPCEDYYS